MPIVVSLEEKKNQRIAAILTAFITALVLILLIFLTFKSQILLDTGDDGVMVQMGDPDMGGPDNTPQTEQLVPVKPQVEESSDNTMTTNQDDGVVIDESDKKKTKKTDTKVEETQPEKKVESALEKAMREAREAQETSKGQGDGTKTGTQGEPDGKGTSPTGGGTGTQGTGSGNFELGSGFGNRGLGYVPSMVSKCTDSKGGTVVLKIQVLPNGTITSAKGGERGTTIFDDCLMKEAEQMALRVKLTATSQPGVMEGNLTIRFRN